MTDVSAFISSLSLVQLKELERQIPREVRRRQAEERQKVRRDVEDYIKAHGFQLEELFSAAAPRTRSFGTAAPKYRHPTQNDLTWSGRGRKPKWVEAWLETGNLSDLEI